MSNRRVVIFFAGLLALLVVGGILEAQIPTYSNTSSVTSPASYAAAITPSDSADLAAPCRAIWVGGAGNIVVNFVNGGSDIVLNGATAGSIVPVRVKRVKATNTTATNLVCLY